MRAAITTLAILWIFLTMAATQPALVGEVIRAEDLAARCATSGGSITLEDHLSIAGGAAEVSTCTLTLNAFRLEIRETALTLKGDLTVMGDQGSSVQVDQSALVPSDRAEAPVNVTLVAQRMEVQNSRVETGGNVHLVGHRDFISSVRISGSDLRSWGGDLFMAASQNAADGRIELHGSKLLAAGSIVLTLRTDDSGHRGEIRAEGNAMLAGGNIRMLTEDGGRVRVRRNNRTLEWDDVFTGITALGILTITSGSNGETEVRENRVTASEGAQIRSDGQTAVRGNNFNDSGPLFIQGTRCEARDNTPPVSCIR